MKTKMVFGKGCRKTPTPLLIVQIAKSIKRLMVVLCTSAFFMESNMWLLTFAVGGWFVDEVQDWFGEVKV